MSRKLLGLALGSGAARGWAHMGVIRALEEEGVRVDMIAGTSMGALVGAAYAAGRLKELEQTALSLDWKQIVGLLDFRFPRSGLIDGGKVENFVREHVKSVRFEDLEIPLAIVATDLYGAEQVVMREGDLIEAVRASISLPGIFTPVEKDGRYLVDGGLVNPVPVSVLKEMGAEEIIAVDLNHSLKEKARLRASRASGSSPWRSKSSQGLPAWLDRLRKSLNERAAKVHPALVREIAPFSGGGGPSIFDVLVTTIAIAEVRITESNLRLASPDLLIRPAMVDFTFLEFDRAGEAIDAGYEATREALAKWQR